MRPRPARTLPGALACLVAIGCGGPDDGQWTDGRTLVESLNRFYASRVAGYQPALVRAHVRVLCSEVEARAEEITEEAIGRILFGPEGLLQYAPNARDELLYCPEAVLSRRRGNCLGLATVFLMVAEHFGIEASAVLQPKPSHVVVASPRGCWDPTKHFRPVDREEVSRWATVGSHGWYGVPLPQERLVATHITTAAAVLTANGIHGTDALYRMAYVADGTNPDANQGLAQAAILTGDWAAAERHARMAYESDPASKTSRELVKAVTDHREPVVSTETLGK